MAMLAEAKSKQKWSQDPRNINWSGDKDRYGYQMLERMGWADGKGLGKDKNGSTSNIKIKKRKQNLGLGAKESHDNDWIAQQADFNNLLSALQQHGGNAELRSEEQNKKAMLEVAKASRKRVFYKRFIRSKDTSQYSQKDMACIFGNLPSQSTPTTPLNQSDDEVESEDSIVSCPTIPCDSTSGFVTYTSKQNIQEYFACRMKELQDGKGIERSNEGDKGVNCEKPRDTERMERGDGMYNQGDKGVCCDREGEGKSKGKKRGNSENSSEVDSQKMKKRKKSKCVSGNGKESLVDGNTAKVKKSKKAKTKDKLKDMDCIETIANDMGSVIEENENELYGEETLSKENTVKKSKKVKKKDKLKDMDGFETKADDMASVTEENENELYGKQALSKENTVKKSKKVKKKDKLKDVASSETKADDMGSVIEENEKDSCTEETSSNRGRDKMKTKKSRKKRMKDDLLVTMDKDLSCTIEDSVDGVPELNDEAKEKGKKGKRKKKRNSEVGPSDGSENVANGVGDEKDENNLCDDEMCLKQDKVNKKKNKKRTKHDKKGD